MQFIPHIQCPPNNRAKGNPTAYTDRLSYHTGDYVKRYPVDKETADHSLYYLVAIAVTDRAVGPAQYTPDRYASPVVRALIDKVSIAANTDLDDLVFAGIAHISTQDGRELVRRVDYPKGNSRNPMNDKDLVEKFRGTAVPVVGEEAAARIVDRVFELETLSDVGTLMSELRF